MDMKTLQRISISMSWGAAITALAVSVACRSALAALFAVISIGFAILAHVNAQK